MMLPGGLTRRSATIAILAPVAGLALLAAVDLGDRRRLAFHPDRAACRRLRRALGHRRPPLRAGGAAADPRPDAGRDADRDARDRRRRPSARARARAGGGDPAGARRSAGLIAAGIAGSLFNDSGPVLLMFETFFAAALVLYLRADPKIAEPDHPAR